jgi:hypothetical protein
MQILKALYFILLLFITYTKANAQQAATYQNFRHRLDSIVSTNQTNNSTYYHFARLYQLVSDGVAKLSQQGKIKDTAFISLLETSFGNYYIKNFNCTNNDSTMAYGWQKALDTFAHTNNYATSLILSMSAHVNHDLFFALTDVFKQCTPTKDNKKDYKQVAKVHDKLIADYFENIMPHLKADKKWKRQAIRKLAKQAAKGLKIERTKIWNEAKKAAVNDKKFARYSKRHKKISQQIADNIIAPKGLLKKGIDIANMLDKLSFDEKAFLLNNQRP